MSPDKTGMDAIRPQGERIHYGDGKPKITVEEMFDTINQIAGAVYPRHPIAPERVVSRGVALMVAQASMTPVINPHDGVRATDRWWARAVAAAARADDEAARDPCPKKVERAQILWEQADLLLTYTNDQRSV